MSGKENKICVFCQDEFEPKVWNHKTCSTACADKINRARSKNNSAKNEAARNKYRKKRLKRDIATYGSAYDWGIG